MNKTTEALKLAEEALSFYVEDFDCAADVIALAAIREALAEREKQEPVEYHVENVYERGDKYFAWIGDGYVQIFTAPVSAKREWVDLTEGEQEAIYLKCNTPSEYTNAVIAAFKEKNR